MAEQKKRKLTSVGKKILMALSGFFLLVFLLQHLLINFLSVFSEPLFNEASEFMGTNPFVQFALQPVLFFGIVFHLVMGIVLEIQNRRARPIRYAVNRPQTSSSLASRSMIITGMMILLFLCLHLYSFFIPSIKAHYITREPLNTYALLVAKFSDPVYTAIYLLAFVFLMFHLLHGFQSAFQSVGFNHKKYTPLIKKLGVIYAVGVPAGFAFIALFHLIKSL